MELIASRRRPLATCWHSRRIYSTRDVSAKIHGNALGIVPFTLSSAGLEVTTERANAMASFPGRFGRVDGGSVKVSAAMLLLRKCVDVACLHVVSGVEIAGH